MPKLDWSARSIFTCAGAMALVTALGAGVAVAAQPDDRSTTEQILREIRATSHKDAASEMVARSRAALARAAKLRASGDEARARLADGLARSWAEAAREVLRAVDVEEKAQAVQRGATDAGVVAERERALLEEGIAQTGRLRAQLDAASSAASEQPARTSAAAPTGETASKPRPPRAAAPDAGAR